MTHEITTYAEASDRVPPEYWSDGEAKLLYMLCVASPTQMLIFTQDERLEIANQMVLADLEMRGMISTMPASADHPVAPRGLIVSVLADGRERFERIKERIE